MSSAPASQVNFFGHSKHKIKDTDLFCASMVNHVSFKKALQKIQTASLCKHRQVIQTECAFPDTKLAPTTCVLQMGLKLQVSLDPSASTTVTMTWNDQVYTSPELSMDVTKTNKIGSIPVSTFGTRVNFNIILTAKQCQQLNTT